MFCALLRFAWAGCLPLFANNRSIGADRHAFSGVSGELHHQLPCHAAFNASVEAGLCSTALGGDYVVCDDNYRSAANLACKAIRVTCNGLSSAQQHTATVAEGGCGKTIASTLHDSGTRADHAEDDAVLPAAQTTWDLHTSRAMGTVVYRY